MIPAAAHGVSSLSRQRGQPGHLRLASYNVHSCVGTDGRRDVGRVAQVMGEIDADVIGLQEVDCGYRYAHEIDQLDELRATTGMIAIGGPTMTREAYTFGNALFTRLPVLSVRHVDLSIKRFEPRAALDVDLDVAGVVMRVMVTHFGLMPWERRWQAATLLQALRGDEQDLTVLCGDFNEWTPMWKTVRQLDAYFGPALALRTFPSRRPMLALDRIWLRPRDTLAGMWVHQSPVARVASDHLPICADLAL